MLLGGISVEHDANEEVQGLVDQVSDLVREQVGGDVSELRAVKYCTQVVAGRNYYVKTHLGNGRFAHLCIHKGLPHTGNEVILLSIQQDKQETDRIEYF